MFQPEISPSKSVLLKEFRALADDDRPIALELKDLEDVRTLHDAFSERLKARGVSDSDRRRFLVSVEEIVVNALVHARATVSVTANTTDRAVSATVRFGGEPYDVAAAARTAKAGHGDRPGGYGLYIAHRYVDRIHHGHADGENIVTLEREFE